MIDNLETQTSISSTGYSSTKDTGGYDQVSFIANVSAISGSGATIQFEIEASDDGTNFFTVHSTKRISSVTYVSLSGIRISTRYYRYSWIVAGSSPSINFTITTTIKNYAPSRTNSLFRYNDLNLKSLNATSTVFTPFSNTKVACLISRDSDSSTSADIKLQVSNDETVWYDHISAFSIASGEVVDVDVEGTAHRFYRIIVSSAATGGTTSTLSIFWVASDGV